METIIHFTQDELNILFGLLEFSLQAGKLQTVQAVAYLHGKVLQAVDVAKAAVGKVEAELPLTPTEEIPAQQ